MGWGREKTLIINYRTVTFCGNFLADLGISFSEKKSYYVQKIFGEIEWCFLTNVFPVNMQI